MQIRSINSRGRMSEFSLPPLQFLTLDKNMQSIYRVAAEVLIYILYIYVFF